MIWNEPELSMEESAAYRRAKSKAMDLLTGRAYTRRRLIDKLVEHTFPKDVAEAAADRMTELGLLNDRAYGEQYITYLTETKRFGLYRVKQEMRNRGIPDEIAQDLLEDCDVDWVENALYWLRKKYGVPDDDERLRRRIFSGLNRYGFSIYEIKEALQILEYEDD